MGGTGAIIVLHGPVGICQSAQRLPDGLWRVGSGYRRSVMYKQACKAGQKVVEAFCKCKCHSWM